MWSGHRYGPSYGNGAVGTTWDWKRLKGEEKEILDVTDTVCRFDPQNHTDYSYFSCLTDFSALVEWKHDLSGRQSVQKFCQGGGGGLGYGKIVKNVRLRNARGGGGDFLHIICKIKY